MEWESDSPSHSYTYPKQGCRSPEGTAGGSWSLGIVEQTQGEGCCWLWRDRSRGCKGGDGGGKCLWREAGQPWKQGNTAESHIEDGTIAIASLSPAGSISSWTIERLAHQIPDAPTQGTPLSDWCTTQQSRAPPRVPLQVPDKLIYREGPQQWGLLHVPDVSNNIEGLQARELLSTWTGRAMEKDW